MTTCSLPDCDAPHKGRGYCNRHLIRLRRHGDPLRAFGFSSVEDRFWAKVDKDSHPGGCWEWQSTLRDGYGTFHLRGSSPIGAHIFSWQLANGPVPKGLQLDHKCRNRKCCNPAHLESVTQKINILRGESPQAVNARKTHCLRGHELSADNVYMRKDRTGRDCRKCRRQRRKK